MLKADLSFLRTSCLLKRPAIRNSVGNKTKRKTGFVTFERDDLISDALSLKLAGSRIQRFLFLSDTDPYI